MADDDLLTQQEIDALLNQAPSVEQPAEQVDARPYRLGREEQPGPHRLIALDVVAERFCEVLRDTVEETFDVEIKIGSFGRELTSFGQLCGSAPEQTATQLFRLPPMPGLSLLILDGELVHRLVDHYFSGPGETPAESRPLSPSELRLAERFNRTLLERFEACWDNVLPVRPVLEGSGTRLSLLNQLAADERLLCISFALEHDQWTSTLWLALSARGISAFQDRLSSAPADQDAERRNRWRTELGATLMSTDVPLRCCIATAELTLRDIVALQAGDVIPANVPERHRAFAGPVPCLDGRENADDAEHTAGHVDHGRPGAQRPPWRTGHVGETTHHLGHFIQRRALLVGPGEKTAG